MPQRVLSDWLAMCRSCSNNSCKDISIASKSNELAEWVLPVLVTTGKAPVGLLARNSRRLTNELLFDDDTLLPEPGV